MPKTYTIGLSDDLVKWTKLNAAQVGIKEEDWLLAKITEGYFYDLIHDPEKVPPKGAGG